MLVDVGLVVLGVVVVEGLDEGEGGVVDSAGVGVNVGSEGLAELREGAEGRVILPGVRVDTTVISHVLRTVSAEDRAEGSPLQPARVQLGLRGLGVAAQVVAPEGVAHIGCSCSEIGLEGEGLPVRCHIALREEWEIERK